MQLLSRHWLIRDLQGKVVAEVQKGSRGVVGCTPLIKPGDCFQVGWDVMVAGLALAWVGCGASKHCFTGLGARAA